jgi:hypothetical protein
VDWKPYDSFIIEEGKKYGIDRVIELINDFENKVINKLEEVEPKTNVFDYFNIKYTNDDIKDLHFVKDGLWDLNPQNAFINNDEIYVYDQEWYLENIPKEFIIYRGILVWNELNEIADRNYIFEKLGLDKYKKLFDDLEKAISNSIMYKHINDLWNKPQRNVRGLLVENANLETKLRECQNELASKNIEIESIKKSTLWKITKPLRNITKHLK